MMKKICTVVFALLLGLILSIPVMTVASAAGYDVEMEVGTTKKFYYSAGFLGTVYGYNWYIPDSYSPYARIISETTTSCIVEALRPGEFEVVYWLECDYYGSVRGNWWVLAKPAGYTISYDANGGYNAPAEQLQEDGYSITLSTTIPRRDGYIFQGWLYNGNLYQPGATYTFSSNVTLTASWKFDHYIIKYNANGGSNAPASQNKYPGQSIQLSSTVPTRQGYVFKGWATSSSASIAECQPGDPFYVDAFTTLYAVWEKIHVQSVKLSDSSLTLMFDSSHLLKATVYPAEASQAVTWSSDNTSVATVSSLGTVTAVGTGTATITATATDQKTAQCKVTVVSDPAKTVKLSSSNFPDYYFRNYLINKYDNDGNGYLGEAELALIQYIYDLPNNTSSVAGMKYLTSLTQLSCSFTKITSVDVSGSPSLKFLRASDGFLGILDSVKYDYLKTVRADGCPALEEVELESTSNVTSVYINNCPSLLDVGLSNNSKVSSIRITNCHALEELSIPAISVDLSDCYSLRYLCLFNYSDNGTMHVNSIDISNCPALVSLYYKGKKENISWEQDYEDENTGDRMRIPLNTSIIADATLSILKQPVSVEAEPGEKVVFFTGATGKVVTFQWQEKKSAGWVDIPGANSMKLEMTAEKSGTFRCKVTDKSGESIVSDAVSLTIQYPSFGTPDFVMPSGLKSIKASAFEGIDAKIVSIPASCTSIGDYAFCNSSIQKIRIPKNCTIGKDVFSGCSFVYIYGPKGSKAEAYCLDYDNCVFVAE